MYVDKGYHAMGKGADPDKVVDLDKVVDPEK